MLDSAIRNNHDKGDHDNFPHNEGYHEVDDTNGDKLLPYQYGSYITLT